MTKKTVKRERTGYITRNVRQDFWTDPTFEDWTPEDRYFYLYLITSAETQLGIWRFNRRIAAVQLGYSPETIENLLNRFTEYGEIEFSEETHEICLLDAGINVVTVGGYVGHADERTTFESYHFDTHTSDENREAVKMALKM